MLQKIKVSEIAKDLALASKDIVALLEQYGVSVKYTTVLEEKQLNIIFEALTKKYDKGGEFNIPNKEMGYGYIAPKKVAPPKEEKAKEEAPKENKTEKRKHTKKKRKLKEKPLKLKAEAERLKRKTKELLLTPVMKLSM